MMDSTVTQNRRSLWNTFGVCRTLHCELFLARRKRKFALPCNENFRGNYSSVDVEWVPLTFRIIRSDLKCLGDKVWEDLKRNEVIRALQNGIVEPEVRLAIVLRILAEASCLELVIIWPVARPIVHQVFSSTIEVLRRYLRFDESPNNKSVCVNIA